MKQITKVALLIILALTLTTNVIANPKAKKRHCTVSLVGGGMVQGYFLGANSRQVIVEVEGARKTISLDQIANILFIVDFKNRRMEADPR